MLSISKNDVIVLLAAKLYLKRIKDSLIPPNSLRNIVKAKTFLANYVL